MDSHEVMGKGYIITKTSQMTSTGAILTLIYHTKQQNPWPNSSGNHMVNYSRLSIYQGDMQPFEGDLSTHGHLTDKPQKQATEKPPPRQLSVSVLAGIVSQCVQLLFDGETFVLLLCAAFLKSGHKWRKLLLTDHYFELFNQALVRLANEFYLAS